LIGFDSELVLATHQDTQFNPPVISFGPYILPQGKPAQVSDIFSYTGFALEFASEECSGTVSLYRIKDGMGGLSDFFVQEKNVFCTIRLFGIPISDPVLGKLHPLESLITALYLNHKPATSLAQFLTDLRERIPLRPGYKKRKPEFKGLLRKDLDEAGFELIEFWQYGRVYNVSLGWVFPQDRNNPKSPLCLYAAGFEQARSRPNIGKGKMDDAHGCDCGVSVHQNAQEDVPWKSNRTAERRGKRSGVGEFQVDQGFIADTQGT
jgi:hypothetical protein